MGVKIYLYACLFKYNLSLNHQQRILSFHTMYFYTHSERIELIGHQQSRECKQFSNLRGAYNLSIYLPSLSFSWISDITRPKIRASCDNMTATKLGSGEN
jgi:hypothetical protein